MEKLAILGGPKRVTHPLEERWQKLGDDLKAAVNALIDEGTMSLPHGDGIVGEFEKAFAEMAGTRYALSMNSGTATLHSAYFAVGVGPGSEVIVPTYTWHATITPIIHCAATPVFCDISPDSLTADPDDIERKITDKTKAICVVHAFGNVCDMDRITAIARGHNLALIEDASHAHGAKWNGKPVGSLGNVGCFSMQGSKPVSGGESGVATTDDAELYDRMVLLGHFGREKIGVDQAIVDLGDMSLGTKYRPHPWAIACANEQLARLPELNEKRTRNYEQLNARLKSCAGIETIDALPGAERGGYLEFKFKLTPQVLQMADRQKIAEAMWAEGVHVTADRYSDFNYTYGLLHTAPLFTTFDRRTLGGCFYDPTLTPEEEAQTRQAPSLPVAEDLCKRLLSMNACTDVTEEALDDAAAAMIKVLDNVDQLG